ncbi:hypothetical protein CGLO_00069 [Colletotrichum gloeosporioides Cg-14]|uniref:Arylsulfotransferase n=1 Tax=Colletotrichum gloeosporioides (strain Cg-14) TaxID=1237896 RepID=T0KVH7_COLGC|nr:hypothetical protein CGLO_00069 [Colletotrichum gloeosporioides Cg-14]
MNNKYRVVKTVQPGTAGVSVDLHEFRLTTNNTALFTLYQPRIRDGMWILDSCFQEVDLENDTMLFNWCSLDHVDVSQSHVPFNDERAVGNGQSQLQAWDYFHINSVEKVDNGDYIISCRHIDAVLLISHVDGSIVWQLGGDRSTFSFDDFDFRRQHDARIFSPYPAKPNLTGISLFNNGNDDLTVNPTISSGLIVLLNHTVNTAHLLTALLPPTQIGDVGEEEFSSRAMGNLQMLPNGNILVNYAENGAMIEYTASGIPVWAARLRQKWQNYRAFKIQPDSWTGNPQEPPALWTYSKTASPSSSTACYASWNGATEVSTWRFWGSTAKDGDFKVVAEAKRSGFETKAITEGFWPWLFVEALDGKGSRLRNSSLVGTYVPDKEGIDCGIWHCFVDDGNGLGTAVVDEMASVSHEHSPSGIVWAEHVFALLGLFCSLAFCWRYIKLGTSGRDRYFRLSAYDM